MTHDWTTTRSFWKCILIFHRSFLLNIWYVDLWLLQYEWPGHSKKLNQSFQCFKMELLLRGQRECCQLTGKWLFCKKPPGLFSAVCALKCSCCFSALQPPVSSDLLRSPGWGLLSITSHRGGSHEDCYCQQAPRDRGPLVLKTPLASWVYCDFLCISCLPKL